MTTKPEDSKEAGMSVTDLEKISEQKCFGGTIGYYRHNSEAVHCPMRFSVFTPAETKGPVPVLWYLSGLTCTEDNFTVKAGAYRKAAELGLMIVAPDTSPRGEGVPNDDAYDFGQGAGFYLEAIEEPWAKHFHMYAYVVEELPKVIFANFKGDRDRQGIFGHSMGGHGAITIALKNPGTYKSISAFAPISAPMQCPWGEKALTGYLGSDRSTWEQYDSTQLLLKAGDRSAFPKILVDQGGADPFLERELKPELLKAACEKVNQKLELRLQDGYDHSYFFISTFIDDHLNHHAALLKG
jgi:S-formylglutathione hydrolase